ncbi:hypothetical protein ACIRRA_00730 [Nocardia sp. NPDC101769]|uniref:hypothetical protein n=1 Tax=Nocardia sp. NPDC101769 TaxID=3364333 RepID=UPI00382F3C8F
MGIAQNDHRGVTVRVSMAATGIDDERSDRQTPMPRVEPTAMDGVESAVSARDSSGKAPGAKVTDPVTIGAIVLAMSASGGVFTTLVAGDGTDRPIRPGSGAPYCRDHPRQRRRAAATTPRNTKTRRPAARYHRILEARHPPSGRAEGGRRNDSAIGDGRPIPDACNKFRT